MKGIVIDPKTRTVTECDDYNGDFRSIYGIIGADLFDCVRIDESETIFVDDEGLVNGNGRDNGFFYVLGDNPIALAGKAVVLGTDEDGNTIASSLTVEDVRKIIRFGSLVSLAGKVFFIAEDGTPYSKGLN